MSENSNNDFSYFEEFQEDKKALPCEEEQKKNVKTKVKIDVKRLVGIAMFTALAYATTFVFRLPVSFLTFDAKDAVIAVASFIYGPISAVIMSFLAAFIEFISISGTGAYGLIMNFASSAAFSGTAALIYKYRRSFLGAIISIYSASFVTVALMLCLNLLVTPYYMGVDVATVKSIIPTLILPFNAAKSLMNSALAMILYKPISQAMRRAGLIKGKIDMKFNKQSAVLITVAFLTAALAITIFVITKTLNS